MYWALGNTPFDLEAKYKSMTKQALTSSQSNQLIEATNDGRPLEFDEFQAKSEKQGAARVRPSKRGRSFKVEINAAQTPLPKTSKK